MGPFEQLVEVRYQKLHASSVRDVLKKLGFNSAIRTPVRRLNENHGSVVSLLKDMTEIDNTDRLLKQWNEKKIQDTLRGYTFAQLKAAAEEAFGKPGYKPRFSGKKDLIQMVTNRWNQNAQWIARRGDFDRMK